MALSSHNKDGFFKYYTAASAKLTLKNAARKWSSPLLFNDPFDNQFDLHFEEPTDKAAEESLNQFLKTITSPEPFKPDQFGPLTPAMELIRQTHIENPDFKYTQEEIAYLMGGQHEGMQRVAKETSDANTEIHRIMADITVLCLSETHDNLLMWSHYAESHKGAVVKFMSLQEVDSPLLSAQPVRYSSHMPRLKFASLMGPDDMRKTVLDTITLSKSDVWAYEKEWRIIASLRNKALTYEILPYAPEEVGAVYLGCNMTKEDQDEIIDVTRRQYVKAKIFEAKKHGHEFALLFKEIS